MRWTRVVNSCAAGARAAALPCPPRGAASARSTASRGAAARSVHPRLFSSREETDAGGEGTRGAAGLRAWRAGGVEVLSTRCDAPHGAAASAWPLLFCHGGFHNAHCWTRFLTELERQGRPAHALSVRCHGGSRNGHAGGHAVTLRHWVQDIATASRAIAERDPLGRRPVLVGHSAGGGAAQAALQCAPHAARAAVLLCAFPPAGALRVFRNWLSIEGVLPAALRGALRGDAGAVLGTRRLFRAAMLSDAVDDDTLARAFAGKEAVESTLVPARLVLGHFVEPWRHVGKVAVVGGELDALMTREVVAATAAAYGTRAVMVPACAHDAMIDVGWRQALHAVTTAADELVA